MTHGQKVRILQTALSLQGIFLSQKDADKVVTTYGEILSKGKKFKLKTVLDIEHEVDQRYEDLPVVETVAEITHMPFEEKKEPATIVGDKYRRRGKQSKYPEHSLGEWLTRDSTLNRLRSLNGKYQAGIPVRIRTLLLKHGSQELLNKPLDQVVKEDLVTLPRMGEQAWNAFIDATQGLVQA
jgi:hypothetical protein